MIPCQRDAFDIPEDVAYFNCAYMGPMLKVVRKAAEAALARTGQPWQVTADDFFTPPERARSLFARLINARPGDVAITPSASFGISTAANNLRIARGQTIVMLDEEFPSNVYAWRLARAPGEIRHRSPAARRDPTILTRSTTGRDRRAAHRHWTDGGHVDLERSAALQAWSRLVRRHPVARRAAARSPASRSITRLRV
jgi:selenocysteine lyase/cysteine desulfurase